MKIDADNGVADDDADVNDDNVDDDQVEKKLEVETLVLLRFYRVLKLAEITDKLVLHKS